jgi:hypothetical protein
VTSAATAFRAPCDCCRADLELGREAWSVGLRATVVEGTLCAEADVGFMTCKRGHRIVVKRAAARQLSAVG